MEKEQEDLIKRLMLPIKYVIMPVFFVFMLYLFICNPLWERDKQKTLSEIGRGYEGVLLDVYLSGKGVPFINVLLPDSTIVKESISSSMGAMVEPGDSILKLEGLNECIILNRRTGKRYLVSYARDFKGVTDSIVFPSDKKRIMKKYPGIKIIEMADGQAKEQIKERKIRVNYKMD